jgi:drug/metabolite transporter (DMT)-like permease
LFAFGGALGQGLGLVISSYGMSMGAEKYDPFLSTQIRVIAAIVGFSVMLTFAGHWKNLFKALHHVPAMLRISTGAVFGPFLGVSFSLLAVQHTTTGVASTIMAIVPVLIIPPAVIILKQKVTTREIIGAVLAVAGVVVLFAF